MRSLLVALQEGRLVELTDSDKRASLELLSNLIEAIPSVPPSLDIFRTGVALRDAFFVSFKKLLVLVCKMAMIISLSKYICIGTSNSYGK